MKLTVTLIDNCKPREAIPVRAVPLVTDWFISADSIAIALAGEDGVFRYSHTAYIQTGGELEAIPPADWHLIANQLQALNASLPEGDPGKYEWAYHKYAEFFGGKHPNGLRQVAAEPTPELLGWIKSRQIAQAKAKQKQETGHASC